MKIRYLVILLGLLGCGKTNEANLQIENTFWISKTLKYYPIDPALGIKPNYGSGQLFYFDKNKGLKSLTRDFYYENDSLYFGGEPGLIRQAGNYQKFDESVTLEQKLVEKTFLLPGEKIGKLALDTLIIHNNYLFTKNDTLILEKSVSQDIKKVFSNVWY